MPDNDTDGMLEDFIHRLVPAADGCKDFAEEAAVEAKRRGAPYAQPHFAKAKIHSWLAWQEPPGMPFGTAILGHCFDADSSEAVKFVQWFRQCFPESG